MKLELLEPYFLKLLIGAEIGFLKQFFQPLSITIVFRVQPVNLCAQRGNLYFIHQTPPVLHETHIAPFTGNPQVAKSQIVFDW
jgi:hypothetical protein